MTDEEKPTPPVSLLSYRRVNNHVVQTLEHLLDLAKEGRITNLMGVGLGPGQPMVFYDDKEDLKQQMALLGMFEVLKTRVTNELV